jgi:hypothetical protein
MKQNKIIIFFLLLFVFCANSFSQQTSVGGSVYSKFGIGDQSPSLSYFNGLAGTSIAMPSLTSPNLINPANLSHLRLTRFETGYNFNQYGIGNQNGDVYQYNSNVNGIAVSMALDTTYGVSIAFGFSPYSSVGFSSKYSLKATPDDGFTGTEGEMYASGSGGLSQAYFGISAKFYDISIGIMPLYYFGEINTREEALFNLPTSSENSYNSSRILTDNFSGLGFKLGLAYEVNDDLNLGFYFNPEQKLEVNRELALNSSFLTKTTFDTTQNIILPMSYGIGFSYKMGKYIMGADFNGKQTSKLNYKIPENTNKFLDIWSVTAGIIIEGSKLSGSNVFQKTDLMFGLGYKPMYINIDSEKMSDKFFSFGFSLPFGESALFNTSVMLGQRGILGESSVEEKYAKVVFSLSIGEQWFKPFRTD